MLPLVDLVYHDPSSRHVCSLNGTLAMSGRLDCPRYCGDYGRCVSTRNGTAACECQCGWASSPTTGACEVPKGSCPLFASDAGSKQVRATLRGRGAPPVRGPASVGGWGHPCSSHLHWHDGPLHLLLRRRNLFCFACAQVVLTAGGGDCAASGSVASLRGTCPSGYGYDVASMQCSQCANGFTGPGCNTCQTDAACQVSGWGTYE